MWWRRAEAMWLIPGFSLCNPAQRDNPIKPGATAKLGTGFGAGWILGWGHGGPGGTMSLSGRCRAAEVLGHQVGKLRHRVGDSMWLCSSWGPGQEGGSHPCPSTKNKPKVPEKGGWKRLWWQHPCDTGETGSAPVWVVQTEPTLIISPIHHLPLGDAELKRQEIGKH